MIIKSGVRELSLKMIYKLFAIFILYLFAVFFSSFCFGRVVYLDLITWILILLTSMLAQFVKSDSYRYIAYFWCLWPIIGISNSGAWVIYLAQSL